MINKIICIFIICLCLTSCNKDTTYLQPYEMTVKLVDRDGQPIIGRQLNLITGYDQGKFNISNGVKDSLLTDSTGSAIFKYDIRSSDAFDINPYVVLIRVVEDSTYVGVNYIRHGLDYSGSQSHATSRVKLSGTIRMDSIVPFKIRLKTNKANVVSFLFNLKADQRSVAEYEANKLGQNLERSFINLNPIGLIPQLDTLLSTKIYSKTRVSIVSSIKYNDGMYAYLKMYELSPNVDRNSILLIDY